MELSHQRNPPREVPSSLGHQNVELERKPILRGNLCCWASTG